MGVQLRVARPGWCGARTSRSRTRRSPPAVARRPAADGRTRHVPPGTSSARSRSPRRPRSRPPPRSRACRAPTAATPTSGHDNVTSIARTCAGPMPGQQIDTAVRVVAVRPARAARRRSTTPSRPSAAAQRPVPDARRLARAHVVVLQALRHRRDQILRRPELRDRQHAGTAVSQAPPRRGGKCLTLKSRVGCLGGWMVLVGFVGCGWWARTGWSAFSGWVGSVDRQGSLAGGIGRTQGPLGGARDQSAAGPAGRLSSPLR